MRSLLTPVGKLSSKLCLYPDSREPFEVWLEVSKSGSEVNAIREAFARLMSLFLRIDSAVAAERKVEMLIEQLEGLSGGNPVGFGPNRVLSLPDGIAKSLRMALDAARNLATPTTRAAPPASAPQALPASRDEERALQSPSSRSDCDVCPTCHSPSLYRVEGCQKCSSCGYSRC